MQATKQFTKPHQKYKKVIEQKAYSPKNLVSKSALVLRSVASTPVRRQLPLKLSPEYLSAVKRMQAFISWAAPRTLLKTPQLTAKQGAFKRLSRPAVKRVRRQKLLGSRTKKVSSLVLKRQPGLSPILSGAPTASVPASNSLWSFLTWYKQARCSKATRQWRLKQQKLLRRLALTGLGRQATRARRRKILAKSFQKSNRGLFTRHTGKKPEVASRKYALVRALYLAQYQIKYGVCPTEAKVRFLQKRYKMWYLRRHRKVLSNPRLAWEFGRILARLSVFVAKFNRLKTYQKNATKLRAQLLQVLQGIFPKRHSRKELRGKNVRERRQYALAWTLAIFLWRFLSPDFVVRTMPPFPTVGLVPKVSTLKKHASGRLPTPVKHQFSVPVKTTWLTFGNRQATMVARDTSIKYKKVWATWSFKALKPLRSWKRFNKQLFWMGWKEKKKNNKVRQKLTRALNRAYSVKTRLTPAPVFNTVFKRLLTTRPSSALRPILHKNKDSKLARSPLTKKQASALALSRRVRGFIRSKKLARRRLVVKFFWGARFAALQRQCAKLLRRTTSHVTKYKSALFLRTVQRCLVRMKFRRHHQCEYKFRHFSRGQKGYKLRKIAKALRRKFKTTVKVRRNKTTVQKVRRGVMKSRGPRKLKIVNKHRLFASFYRWLIARAKTKKVRVKGGITRKTGVVLATTPKLVMVPNTKEVTSRQKLSSRMPQAKRSRKVFLRRLQRLTARVSTRRLAKRGVTWGMTRKTLHPIVQTSKMLPTPFDAGALRTHPGQKWQKKVRKIRTVLAWCKDITGANVQLSHLYPGANMQAASRKRGQLYLPEATAGLLRQQRLHHLKQQNIDVFPFSSDNSAERKQQFVERKRHETLMLQRSKGRFSAVSAGASSAAAGVLRGLLAAQSTHTLLQRARLSGFIQDLNQLSHQKKVVTLIALKRRFVLPNRKTITRKLKRNRSLVHLPRHVFSALGGIWSKKLDRRRQRIACAKQRFPRKGARRRRYKRGIQKQLKRVLTPKKLRPQKPDDKKRYRRPPARIFKKTPVLARYSNLPAGYVLRAATACVLAAGAQTGAIKKLLNTTLLQRVKASAAWQHLKREHAAKFLSKASYVNPQYRLRFRLFTKSRRAAAVLGGLSNQKKVNRLRRQKAQRLYMQRRTAVLSWNRKNRPFKRTASLGYEEKFKRNLHKLKWADLEVARMEQLTGYPATAGQRRMRRVLVPRFNKNRWWKSLPLTLPKYLLAGLSGLNSSVSRVLTQTRKQLYLPGAGSLSEHRPAFPSGGARNENQNWRGLDRGFSRAALERELAGRTAVAGSALLTLEQSSTYFMRAWAQYAEKTSVKLAAQLRASFIKTAANWLQERPLEKLVSTWTLQEWSNFKAFMGGVESPQNGHRESVEEFKARFICAARQELFVTAPNWWQEEARIRALLLFKAMAVGTLPHTILQALSAAVENRAVFTVQAHLGWQEKKLFIFSSLHTSREERNALFTASLPASTHENKELGDKPFTALYAAWLASVETYLKKIKSMHSSRSYNELRHSVITELGAERPRFLGAGRRKFTFDSLLRSHYTKTMPLRSRHLAGLQLQKIRPVGSALFTSQLPTLEATPAIRRGHRQMFRTGSLGYPSQRRRELLRREGKMKTLVGSATTAKCRFAALPIKIANRRQARTTRKLRVTALMSSMAPGEALLQHALRRRFVARSIRDLRKSGRRRKLPRIYSKPFWVQNRHTRKRNRADRCDLYRLPFAGGYTPAISSQWACTDFSLQVARASSRAVSSRTLVGELLAAPTRLQRSCTASRTRSLRFGGARRRWKRQVTLGFRRVKKNKLVRGKFRWRNLAKIRSRVRRLRKNAKYTNKYYPQQWRLALRTVQSTLERFDTAQRGFHYRFVKQTQPSVLLTPLHFRKHTTQISVSAAEKERWRLHIQATRQRKYRRLIEQSDALTQLFPQLISRVISKKMARASLSLQEASRLVSSIYWSMRVYLQHDFGRHKFVGRDDNVKRILGLNKELTTASAERYFSLAELTQARYRFQPHKLHPGPSLSRGAAEWQRRFLPCFYELNLEDPQKYGHLTITPLKIFRAHVNRKKISEWETRKIPGLMENRFARLTTERLGKNSRCFENMLMTARRIPVIGGYGAAATLQVINPVGMSAVRKPFFSRGFTTSTGVNGPHGNTNNWTLVTSRMVGIRRRVVTESNPVAPLQAVSVHRYLKQNNVSRLRAQQAVSSNETGSGAIDFRLLRAKSPRNAAYVQRGPTDKRSGVSRVTKLCSLLRARGATQYHVFRSNRGFVATTAVPVNEHFQKKILTPALKTTRGTSGLRRQPTFLELRAHVLKQKALKPVFPRLFSEGRFSRQRNMRRELTIFNKNKEAGLSAWMSASVQTVGKRTSAIKTKRSILQFRKASERSTPHYHTRTPVILKRSIKLNQTAWSLLKRYRFDKQLRQQLAVQKVKQKFKWRLAIRTRADYKILRAPVRRYRKISLLRNNVFVGEKFGFLKRSNRLNRFRRAGYWQRTACVTGSEKKASHSLTTYFQTFAATDRRNKKVISNYANCVEQRRARTLFMSRRPQLWRDLTLRWMKKFRLLKHWLKTVKYSFKHKVWGIDGQPALPDTLFKLSRLRLRKLEWREASDRFERHGLRNAFTFHPKERRHARWLEALMYRRSLYNFQRGEYRRDQLPREQKSRKWMQRLRKLMYRRKLTHLYIKRRRWPTLRRYNQKLHRSAFKICSSKAMLKRFRKLTRRKPATTGFEKLMVGFGDRLDVNLMILNIAPTTFWAREIAPMGLFKVNGRIVREPNFRFTPGDHIELMWDKLQKLRMHFASSFKRHDKSTRFQNSSFMFPGNFAYNASLRTAQYLRRPRADDLLESSRINARLFRWSRLDSGLGR